jgi:hypothetical protein
MKTAVPSTFHRGADFSPCGLFRWRLWRTWSELSRPLTFLMLNPSTADAMKNDPTVERCERRARRLGFGGVEVVNIFALRATDPEELYKVRAKAAKEWEPGDDIGTPGSIEMDRFIASKLGSDYRNDDAIREAVNRSGATVCAWGIHGFLEGRANQVVSKLIAIGLGARLHVLHNPKTKAPYLTAEGQPRHPLYLPNDAFLQPWTPKP